MLDSILITAATHRELNCLDFLQDMSANIHEEQYMGVRIIRIVSGVGSVSTLWSVMDYISREKKPTLAINIGIAGSYSAKYNIASVLVPASDCFADMGLEYGDTYKTVWESGLSDPNEFPFVEAEVFADTKLISIAHELFPLVRGITVNTCTGSDSRKELMRSKFNPDIETMEGAGFYYVCKRASIPSIAIRSISNMVEKRNTEAWNIELALEKLASASELLLQNIIEQWN